MYDVKEGLGVFVKKATRPTVIITNTHDQSRVVNTASNMKRCHHYGLTGLFIYHSRQNRRNASKFSIMYKQGTRAVKIRACRLYISIKGKTVRKPPSASTNFKTHVNTETNLA